MSILARQATKLAAILAGTPMWAGEILATDTSAESTSIDCPSDHPVYPAKIVTAQRVFHRAKDF